MNTWPAPHQPCARRASNIFFFNMRSTRLGPAMSARSTFADLKVWLKRLPKTAVLTHIA